jgi:hypothetical protein
MPTTPNTSRVASQGSRPSSVCANLPMPTAIVIRLKTISTSRNEAATRRASSVSRPSPKRVRFHSAKVITPDRRIHFAWNAM